MLCKSLVCSSINVLSCFSSKDHDSFIRLLRGPGPTPLIPPRGFPSKTRLGVSRNTKFLHFCELLPTVQRTLRPTRLPTPIPLSVSDEGPG